MGDRAQAALRPCLRPTESGAMAHGGVYFGVQMRAVRSYSLAGAPPRVCAVHRRALMSIEKNSSGIPEVNVHKRTTKVNLSIIAGIGLFFIITAAVVVWLWASHR